MKDRVIIVNDTMQTGYTYVCSEPEGMNFQKDFLPDLSPKEMLALGVFGGRYMRDCTDEFPKDWFKHVRFATSKADKTLNYFGVFAGLSLTEWRKNGWIYKDDPRGWFQWYCRYYMGRRIEHEDMRQISRWKQMRRHVGQLIRHCRRGDEFCRPRQRQALLQWAYDTRNI